MKKIIFLMLVGLLIGGCSSFSVETPPEITPQCETLDINTLSVQIKHLIREKLYWSPLYKEGHAISRWRCGIVEVYDETNYEKTEEILNLANTLIQGPVVFRLTKDPNRAKVKIIFSDDNYIGEFEVDDLTAECLRATVYIPPAEANSYNVYFRRIMDLVVLWGYKWNEREFKDLKNGLLSEEFKTVVYYAYRLPIGTEIDPTW